MKYPGFVSAYLDDVRRLPDIDRQTVNVEMGLDEKSLCGMLLNPPCSQTVFSPPSDHVVGYHLDRLDSCQELGSRAIASNEVVYCILAGGRDGTTDEPAAFTEVPRTGTHLLGLKLQQVVGTGQVWIMSSPDVTTTVKSYVAQQSYVDSGRIHVFDQFMSYRLTPDNRIVVDGAGRPSLYSCGTGDLYPAMVRSGLLQSFVATGGKYIFVVDVQNVFGTLDPGVVGHHIETSSRITCEVVRRRPEEFGSVLTDSSLGLSLADISILDVTDHERYTWLSTNSFVMNAELDYARLGKTWSRSLRQVGHKAYVQYERSLDEITYAYDTTYLGVPRGDRYMPLRSAADRDIVASLAGDAE